MKCLYLSFFMCIFRSYYGNVTLMLEQEHQKPLFIFNMGQIQIWKFFPPQTIHNILTFLFKNKIKIFYGYRVHIWQIKVCGMLSHRSESNTLPIIHINYCAGKHTDTYNEALTINFRLISQSVWLLFGVCYPWET